jgi:hypothetical protein
MLFDFWRHGFHLDLWSPLFAPRRANPPPLVSKTAPVARQRLEPSFHRMRYGGIATPGRSYQVCLSAFVPSGVLVLWEPDAG